MKVRSLALGAFLVPAMLIGSTATVAAQVSQPIKVMTYNTHHGGTATSPSTTDSQLDTIAAENPDVVLLQEAYRASSPTTSTASTPVRTPPSGTARSTARAARAPSRTAPATRTRA